jgi:hypothetical protein
MTSGKAINAEEFDRRFEAGEDMSDYLDWSRAHRPGLETKRVNLDMPAAMIARLDAHARKYGVTRQALIKMWLADRLERAA